MTCGAKQPTNAWIVGEPVRLRVTYKSAQSLLGEYTRSVGRGGVRLETERALEPGTRFIFELRASGVGEPVEVSGVVRTVSPSGDGKYVLHIRYEPAQARAGLDAVLGRILESERVDPKRRAARIPLQVRAVEDRAGAPVFRLRDLSRGGVGIDVESSGELPDYITVGTAFLLQMRLTTGHLSLHGEVAWVLAAPEDAEAVHPRVGVAFGKMSAPMGQLLDELLAFKVMPSPPWIARVVFGREAVSRMPFERRS